MFHVDGRPVEDKPLVEPTLPYIFEEWKSKIFDEVTWGEHTNDGSFRTIETDIARGCNVIRLTSTGSGLNQMLFGQLNWQARSGDAFPQISGYDNTAALYYTVMDFEAKINCPELVENSEFFMGLIPNTAITTGPRVQNDIIGFILNVDRELASITDLNGAETVVDFAGPPTIDDQLHHYRIWLFDNTVLFTFDHALMNVHTTNLANYPVFPFWGIAPSEEETVSVDITNITLGYRRYPTQVRV